MPVFPIPDPVTPEWLTLVLGEAGALARGSVDGIEQETTGAFNSATLRLRLGYSPDASPDAPARVVLKRNIPAAWGVEAGADEVRFYSLIGGLADHPPITPPCLAAAYDEASGSSYLLLRDLSATHRPPVTRDQQISIVDGVPSAVDIAAVVETLARLHAYWWEHPLLGTAPFSVGYWSRTRERFERYAERRGTAWRWLVEHEGDWLPADVRALYEQVLARLPAHWERHLAPRFQTSQQLTLTHGDAYFANFLCPIPPTTGTTYLLDWQSPSFDIAGYDLANLCATFWAPQQRHENQREEGMLRRYLATLQAHGVRAYSWDDLVRDYRLGLVFWLLMPVQDAAGGSRRDYWWPKMQCLVAAFRDWRCGELLDLDEPISRGGSMSPRVETSTPPNTPAPIGPYHHVAKAGSLITIGGTAGVNPATGQLAGPDVEAQTRQILDLFAVMLASVGSDLGHVLHVTIFLKDMRDFERMNQAYAERMGEHRPARTVIGVGELPKPGALLTMNLTAVTRDEG